MGNNNAKVLVVIEILRSTSSAAFHEYSGGRPGSNENQTVLFRFYRDCGLTECGYTHVLPRLDFGGPRPLHFGEQTIFAFLESVEGCLP